MPQVKLTRLESNHQKLRTDEVVGYTHELPELNQVFQMTAPPLSEGLVRIIHTTPVLVLERKPDGKTYLFTTRNSKYKLEILGDAS